MTPAKGEYLVFSGPSEATLRTPVVPVPSKQTAGVYTFRRCPVLCTLTFPPFGHLYYIVKLGSLSHQC